jgi:hypothetical protein
VITVGDARRRNNTKQKQNIWGLSGNQGVKKTRMEKGRRPRTHRGNQGWGEFDLTIHRMFMLHKACMVGRGFRITVKNVWKDIWNPVELLKSGTKVG